MELKLKLDAQDWTDRTPTKTQIVNLLHDLSDFVNNLGGVLLATGEFHIARQDGPPQNNPIAALLNAAGALKNAEDVFNGTSTSGIVPARAVPQMVPRQ